MSGESEGAVVGRQIHRHGGTLLRRRVDGHEAAAMARDTLHERQAETGPLADLLGGEERLEEMRLHVFGHADAVVAYAKPDVVAGGTECSPGTIAASTVAISSTRESAAARQRVARVDHQVEDDLLDVVRIHQDDACLFESHRQLDILADHARQHVVEGGDRRAELDA